VTVRAVTDLADLPEVAFGDRAPIWWGNVLMLLIEGTAFALLAATYFDLRLLETGWPPPGTPPPDLFVPSLSLAVLLLSIVPTWWTEKQALGGGDVHAVRAGLVVSFLFAAAAVVLRAFEYRGLHCHWDTHAYGSIVWTILGMHTAHLVIASLEDLFVTVLVFRRDDDPKARLDVEMNGIYWYFVVGAWVPLWAIVYLAPRVLR
jgi:cytochrome c oxidase subunit III